MVFKPDRRFALILVATCLAISGCISTLSGVKYYTNKNSYNEYNRICYPVTARVVSHQKETLTDLTHYYITFEFPLPTRGIYDSIAKQMTLSTTCRDTNRMDECTRIMEKIFAKKSELVDIVYVDTQPNPSIHLHNDNPYYVPMLDWGHTFKASIVMTFVTLYILMAVALIYWAKVKQSVYAIILTVGIAIILAIVVHITANHSYNNNYREWSTRQIDLTIKKMNKYTLSKNEYLHPRDSARRNQPKQTVVFEFEFEDHGDFHAYHHVAVPKAVIECPNQFFTHHYEKNMEACVQHYERYFKVGSRVHAYFNRFDDQTVYINEDINSRSIMGGAMISIAFLLGIALILSTAFTGGMTYSEIKKQN